jgi:dihydroorotase
MRKAMDYAKAFGVPVISHAEDANLVGSGVMNEGALSNELGLRGNPAAAEEILVAREIALCRLTRHPIHIAHLSTELAIEHVRRAKDAGLPVTAEATPHHLSLDESAIRAYDTHCKMAPPLRTARDVEALQKAVATGLIDLIATDHAPHGEIDKAVEFDQAANGIIGLQTALSVTLDLVHRGIVTPARWVEALSLAPARLLRIPQGTLRKGADADVTVIDPEVLWTFEPTDIRSKSHNSPYLGHRLRGRTRATIVGGRIAYEQKD